jgi:hypothetical protein
MRTHGTAAAWVRNEISIAENIAICFGVTMLCHVQKSETPSRNSIWDLAGNSDQGGLKRCNSGYCLFKLRILAQFHHFLLMSLLSSEVYY